MEKDSIITQIHSVQGYPTINVWLSGRLTIPGEGNTHKPLTDPNAILKVLNRMKSPGVPDFNSFEDVQKYVEKTGDRIMGNALPKEGAEPER